MPAHWGDSSEARTSPYQASRLVALSAQFFDPQPEQPDQLPMWILAPVEKRHEQLQPLAL